MNEVGGIFGKKHRVERRNAIGKGRERNRGTDEAKEGDIATGKEVVISVSYSEEKLDSKGSSKRKIGEKLGQGRLFQRLAAIAAREP